MPRKLTTNTTYTPISETCPTCGKKLYANKWGKHYIKRDLSRIVCPDEEPS